MSWNVDVFDANGDVPGCSYIKEVAMTETAPQITAANLNWQQATLRTHLPGKFVQGIDRGTFVIPSRTIDVYYFQTIHKMEIPDGAIRCG